MRRGWDLRTPLLIAAGLGGLGLFFVAQHYHLPIAPSSDFGKGLWIGSCLGLEVTAFLFRKRPERGPAP